MLLIVSACLLSFQVVLAADPDKVSFTLEGCRNDGSILLPNGGGQYICPDAAYTTGNLGKGWNELDLVPYRLTADAGNSAPASQTFTIAVVVDREDAGKPGYDVLSTPVLNTSQSNAACVAPVVGNETYAVPGLGGIDRSLYRLVTITQAKNTTCVYDYYARLALGSHEFPGSSLHANLALPDASAPGGITTQGIGARDVSIPVKEIAPQELDKDMNAIQGTDHDWSIVKEPTPARVTFGDTCDAGAPLSASVKVEITWTKEPATPSDTITVKTFIYATNPASRIITVNVTDKIYAGATLIDTANSGDFDVPANTANFLVLTHAVTGVDASATDLNDVATATYVDKVTGVPVPGTTEATASATVELTGPELNQTATINDVESITGAGLSFSADSFAGASGAFDGGYVAGTETDTTGSVSWTSDPQGGSGSVTFDKTIYVDAVTSTSGDLSDTATLKGADGLVRSTDANISITADARVKLTINKTLNPALTAGSQMFTFHVFNSGGAEVAAPTITFSAGEINKSVTIDNLTPDVYKVAEDAVAGCIPQDPKSVNINLPSCSGEVSFSNVKLGRIIVDKVTDPAGPEQLFAFTLTGGPSALNASFALADADTPYDSGYVLPGSGYAAAETVPDGWDLTSAECDNDSLVGNIDVAPG